MLGVGGDGGTAAIPAGCLCRAHFARLEAVRQLDDLSGDSLPQFQLPHAAQVTFVQEHARQFERWTVGKTEAFVSNGPRHDQFMPRIFRREDAARLPPCGLTRLTVCELIAVPPRERFRCRPVEFQQVLILSRIAVLVLDNHPMRGDQLPVNHGHFLAPGRSGVFAIGVLTEADLHLGHNRLVRAEQLKGDTVQVSERQKHGDVVQPLFLFFRRRPDAETVAGVKQLQGVQGFFRLRLGALWKHEWRFRFGRGRWGLAARQQSFQPFRELQILYVHISLFVEFVRGAGARPPQRGLVSWV